MNDKGDNGSPCLRPLELEKKPDASPLNQDREAHSGNTKRDPFPPLVRKAYVSRIAKRKLQET